MSKPSDKNQKTANRLRKRSVMTVRERAEQTSNAKPKSRSVRRTAKKATTPIRLLGRFLKKLLRPFRFLLRPFKTKPAKFIGRILGKIFFINYIRASWKELRLVTWPNRKETRQLTFAVFAFAFVFGLMITIMDYGLTKLFEKVLI